MYEIGKPTQTESRLVVTKAEERRNGKHLLNWFEIIFWGDQSVLELDTGMDAQHCECTRSY